MLSHSGRLACSCSLGNDARSVGVRWRRYGAQRRAERFLGNAATNDLFWIVPGLYGQRRRLRACATRGHPMCGNVWPCTAIRNLACRRIVSARSGRRFWRSTSLPCRTFIAATKGAVVPRVCLTGPSSSPLSTRTGWKKPFGIGMAAIPKTLRPGSIPSSEMWMNFSALRSGYRAVRSLSNVRTTPGAMEPRGVGEVDERGRTSRCSRRGPRCFSEDGSRHVAARAAERQR